MKNLLIALLLTIILIFGFFGKVTSKYNEELKNENFQYRNDISLLQSQNIECMRHSTQNNKFLESLSEVGSIPYDLETANCYDHSKLLQIKLFENNIESSIMINENRDHAWVAVWIEANTGKFIGANNFNVIEVRDRSLGVVCSK